MSNAVLVAVGFAMAVAATTIAVAAAEPQKPHGQQGRVRTNFQ